MAKIKGLDKLLKDLDKFGKDAVVVVDAEMEAVALDMVKIAKASARFDTGKLKQSIRHDKRKVLYHVVEAGGDLAPYAPYHEFGTGGLVQVPKEFEEDAALARGKGIRMVNIMPQPFMHPAYLVGQKELPKKIKKQLDKLAKKV